MENKKMVCIVCPNGCELNVNIDNDVITVTGNKCSKGKEFAITELTHPMRTICTTVKTSFAKVPVLPVRTSAEIPKDKIFEAMNIINKQIVNKKLKRGDIVIKDILNTGVDIIATSDILQKI